MVPASLLAMLLAISSTVSCTRVKVSGPWGQLVPGHREGIHIPFCPLVASAHPSPELGVHASSKLTSWLDDAVLEPPPQPAFLMEGSVWSKQSKTPGPAARPPQG